MLRRCCRHSDAKLPAGRIAEPEEIANVVTFLASEAPAPTCLAPHFIWTAANAVRLRNVKRLLAGFPYLQLKKRVCTLRHGR